MRQLGRGFLWLIAFAMTGGLAWWGWSLGPTPRFVVPAGQPSCPMAFSADGRWLATYHGQSTYGVTIYDAMSGREILDHYSMAPLAPFGHGNDTQFWNSLGMSELNPQAISRIDESGSLARPIPIPDRCRFFREDADGTIFLSQPERHHFTVIRDGKRREMLGNPEFEFQCATGNPSIVVLRRIQDPYQNIIWDAELGERRFGNLAFKDFTQSRDGRWIAGRSADADDNLHVCDVIGMKDALVPLPDNPRYPVNNLAFSPDNRCLVLDSLEASGKITIIDLQDVSRQRTLATCDATTTPRFWLSPTFSQDGRTLITRYRFGQTACWDFNEQRATLRGVFGPLGIEAADGRRTDAFADPADVNPTSVGPWTFRKSPAPYDNLCGLYMTLVSLPSMSSDGRWAIEQSTYNYDHGALLTWLKERAQWVDSLFPRRATHGVLIDLKSMKSVATWSDVLDRMNGQQVNNCRFSPDSSTLAVQHEDGRISVYDLPPSRRVLLPSAMTLPLLGVAWFFWRKRRALRTAVTER